MFEDSFFLISDDTHTYLRTDFEISVLKIILEYIITLCKITVAKASINRDMQNNNKIFSSPYTKS
jgi:hypothetical protein